jgi:transcriptional regulator with XRE-family HTH domain
MDTQTPSKQNNAHSKKIINISSDIGNNHSDNLSSKINNNMLSQDNLLNFDSNPPSTKRKDSAIPKVLISKAIGTRLKIIRLMTGLNLKEFGSMCKIESGMFGRYERGETPLSVASAIRVAITVRDLYHIYTDPNWILTGEGTRPWIISAEEQDPTKKNEGILDTLQAYIEIYQEKGDVMSLLGSKTSNRLVKAQSIIAGHKIDLNNVEVLKNLDYQYCFLRLKDGNEILAHITYDEIEHMFTVQMDNPRKLFCLKVDEVDSLSSVFFNIEDPEAANTFNKLSLNNSEIVIK